MTSGERMVWAAEFVRSLGFEPANNETIRRSAISAYSAVNYMRAARTDQQLHSDVRAMLDDMLGVPR